MLGLDIDTCVTWESNSCAQLFKESLLGQRIGDVFPELSGNLDSPNGVCVWCPGQPLVPFRATASRPSGKTFEWFVALARETDDNFGAAAARLEGANQERAHLAETLHEGPYQVLTALLLQLGKITTTTSGLELGKVRQLVHTVNDSLRGITASLCPPPGPGGLSQKLQALAEIAGRHFRMQVEVPFDHDGMYPPSVEAAVLGAVQAALIFASTHTVASAGVSLHESHSELRVLIELADFTGPLSACGDCIQSDEFIRARGVVSAEMESDMATIVLRFPLDRSGTTKIL